MFAGRLGLILLLVLCLPAPPPLLEGSFLSVLHLCCQSICKHKEIWTNMPSPLPYTRCTHHYAYSLFLAFFLLLNSIFWKACSYQAWWMTTPSFYSSIVFYLGDVCGSQPSIDVDSRLPLLPNDAAVNNQRSHNILHTGADASRREIPRSAAPPFLLWQTLTHLLTPAHNPGSQTYEEACPESCRNVPAFSAKLVVMAWACPPPLFASKFPWVNTSIDDVQTHIPGKLRKTTPRGEVCYSF